MPDTMDVVKSGDDAGAGVGGAKPVARSKQKTEDFSHIVDAQLPELVALAKTNLDEAVDRMLTLEKTTRLGEDLPSTARVCIAILAAIRDRGDWKRLGSHLLLLSKRRGQLKGAVTRFVQEAMSYLPSVPEAERLELINTLRTICEGKIHVELERARLTRMLADIRESKGEIAEASDVLNTIQVETYGSMENREKFEFILEQMRLSRRKGDFIRMEIVSRKVSQKALKDDNLQDLKLRFYELMIQFHQHERRYLDLVRAYQEIGNTPVVAESQPKWADALLKVCVYLVLSPHSNEQQDMLHRTALDKRLDHLPEAKELVRLLRRVELVDFPAFEAQFLPFLQRTVDYFSGEDAAVAREDLHRRITEHNIRVIAAYYSRITMTRLASLLSLTVDEAERFLRDMVTAHGVYARIDRPAGLVDMKRPRTSNEQLNDWAHGVRRLLALVEDTTHMISKELMVHKL